jgi:hypothetical protein
MLYQYLLDEVGRKQVRVINVKKRDDNKGGGIALKEMGRPQSGGAEGAGGVWPARKVGVGGSLGTGLGLGAGEPEHDGMGRKSTGLSFDNEDELDIVTAHGLEMEVPVITRSRSERHTRRSPKKSRGNLLRRLLTGQEKEAAVVAVPLPGGGFGSDDGCVPNTPQVPAFAARVGGVGQAGEGELVRARGGEKRLTM